MLPLPEHTAEFYQALLDNTFDGICEIDAKGRIIAWNKGAERITGHRSKYVVGTPCQESPVQYLHANGQPYTSDELPLLATLQDGEAREIHAFIKHIDGYRASVLIRTAPLSDGLGGVVGVVEIFTDNKTRIASHLRTRQVEQTVLYDELTRIGSRPHIENKIKLALEDYKNTGSPFGVLFIDIDHFKDFNDQHGHLTGDRVLRFVANAIKNHLRVTDSCGRWGGEEFLAIVLDIKPKSLQLVADKLLQVIETSGIQENGAELNVTVSIGACMVQPGDTLDTLIQRADHLMYVSKQKGRNRVTMTG